MTTRLTSPWLLRLAGVTAVIAAFFRGHYLLGNGFGMAYVLLTLLLYWLFANARTKDGRVSLPQLGLAFLVALPVAYGMAYPASIFWEFRIAIDRFQKEQKLRVEITELIASDTAFRELLLSVTRGKETGIRIEGKLPTTEDCQRLKQRLAAECPSLRECSVSLDILLQDTGEHVIKYEEPGFPANDERSSSSL